ncbi:MAG: NUDIX domain-containing protein [Lachnospira sp.]
MVFPKICPAVIIGVTDGDRILLTKYAGRTYKNYALVAGFTEIGETLEQTVEREVMEEVGLHVKKYPVLQEPAVGVKRFAACGIFLRTGR